MSTDYDLPEDVDFLLVRRDDELLDAIARRDHGFDNLGELADDRALTLLAAFATEVDEGLDRLLADLAAETPEPVAPVLPVAPVVPRQVARRAESSPRPSTAAPGRTVTAPASAGTGRRARHAGRAGAAAAVVAAVVSVSGVAAAVTGNPLAPIQKVADSVSSVFGHGPDQHANDRAKLEAQLRDVQALIRAGRYAEAQALLDRIESKGENLSAGDRKGLQNQLDAVQAKIDREVARATATPPGATKAPNANQPTAKPTQAQPSHSPKPSPTRTSGGDGTTHQAATPSPPAAVPTPPATKDHPSGGATHSPKGNTGAKTGSQKG